jgi:hypothetical protein
MLPLIFTFVSVHREEMEALSSLLIAANKA